MKFFTPLHDTLHAVTDHIDFGLKRLRRASTMTSSSHRGSFDQASEPRTISISKPLRKRRRLRYSRNTQDARLANKVSTILSGVIIERTTPLEETDRQLHRLASLHFSSFDSVGAVLKASRSLPRIPISAQSWSQPLPVMPPLASRPTSANRFAKTTGHRHPSLYFLPFDAAGDVLAPMSQPQILSLKSALGDGIWTEDGSVDHAFLRDFMSVETLGRVADSAVPTLLARRLKEAEENPLEFMPSVPQQPRLGSWEFVLRHFSCSIMEESNGTHTWTSHHILQGYEAALQQMMSGPVNPTATPSALDLISQASVRQPTTLMLKQTCTSDIDSEVSFFSFSKGNHITCSLPPSVNPSPAGWSRLEELALDCFISDTDAFQLFKDCRNTLRTAILNFRREGVGLIVPTNTNVPIQMPMLSNLTITSSLPLESFASAFAFPALRELSLTAFEFTHTTDSAALGLVHTGQQAKLSAALQFPWSKLARLALCNSTCDSPRVEDILARCGSLTSFSWKDRYSTEPQPRAPPLMLPLLHELTIDANDCRPLLQLITRCNPRTIKKLSLLFCDDRTVDDLPDDLSDLVVQESMELGTCANVLERLTNDLARANISVTPGELDPFQGPIHMRALRRIRLRGETESAQILSSLINAPNLRESSI